MYLLILGFECTYGNEESWSYKHIIQRKRDTLKVHLKVLFCDFYPNQPR